MSKGCACCCVCRDTYNTNGLYSCYNNHFFCTECYHSYKGNDRMRPRRHCCSWIKAFPGASAEERQPKPMFPRGVPKKASAASSAISMYKSVSAPQLSRRPVNCPQASCNKSIGVSCFDAHFAHEHPAVPVIRTCLENRNGLELHLDHLKCNRKACVALLNVIESGDTRNSSGDFVKAPFVLMAARLPPFEPEDSYGAEETVGDKFLIWLASNTPADLSYTLGLSASCGRIMMKYFGPVVSLEAEPRFLHAEGKGMIVARHQHAGMTDDGRGRLVLDVIVHGGD